MIFKPTARQSLGFGGFSNQESKLNSRANETPGLPRDAHARTTDSNRTTTKLDCPAAGSAKTNAWFPVRHTQRSHLLELVDDEAQAAPHPD